MRTTQNFHPGLVSLTLLATLLCSGCFGSGGSTGTLTQVKGAKDAVLEGNINSPRPASRRPSAPLGLYATTFLASGGFYSAAGAINAVIAQTKLVGKPSQDVLDTTLALLQEFDTVMDVDVVDLLNRSDNRAQTLDAYLQGLKNITERARTRITEINQYTGTLQKNRKDLRSQVSSIDRAARDALKKQDYVLAGEKQQELGKLQGDLAKTEADLKQQQQIRTSYEGLIELSDKRIKAIEQNREVIIAGLRVNNVPGADDLGILDTQQGTRRRTNTLGL